jgi:hypothetical protein
MPDGLTPHKLRVGGEATVGAKCEAIRAGVRATSCVAAGPQSPGFPDAS